MKRYGLLCVGLAAALLALFGVAEGLGLLDLADEPLRGRTGAMAALAGVGLLVVDVVLPVPSSAVMVALGAVFGVALGTVLSFAGSLGAFALAFALGRRGQSVVARIATDAEHRRADDLLRRWGPAAVVLSRPVPILAETVAFLAGASSLRWRSALVAAAVGSAPAAALYSLAGAATASFASTTVVFLVVAALAVAAALITAPGLVSSRP